MAPVKLVRPCGATSRSTRLAAASAARQRFFIGVVETVDQPERLAGLRRVAALRRDLLRVRVLDDLRATRLPTTKYRTGWSVLLSCSCAPAGPVGKWTTSPSSSSRSPSGSGASAAHEARSGSPRSHGGSGTCCARRAAARRRCRRARRRGEKPRRLRLRPPTRSRRATPNRPTRCSTRRDLDMSGRFANVPLRSSPPQAPAEAMGPQDFRVLGPFFVVPTYRRDAMAEIETKHFLANGTQPDAREALEWATETRAQMVDLKFCDLFGRWQHMTLPLTSFEESAFDEGLGFDGSSIRGWQGISESDMLLDPRRDERDPRPVHRGADALAHLRDPRPDDRRGVRQGPAARREARRGVSALDRGRRHGVHRPRVRVLRLRRGLVRARAERVYYAVDSAEGYWNSGKPGLGNTIREKEGYFPPAPHDTLHDLRTRMVLTLERLGIAASSTTTRSRPAASARSTSSTTRSSAWRTR